MSNGGESSLSFPPPPPPSHPPLPPGWEQAICPGSGRPYYANRLTGETSWVPPPYFLPPPPPPVPMMMLPPPPQNQQQLQHQQHNFHYEHPHMHTGAPPGAMSHRVAPSVVAHDVPGDPTAMPPNYHQQYSPNQIEIIPPHAQAMTARPNISIPPQHELQNTVSCGLGPSDATSPGMLVPAVRAMIEAECAQRATAPGAPAPRLELAGLTAGAIADLCNVSREMRARNVDGGDFAGLDSETRGNNKTQGGDTAQDEDACHYLPLQPFSLPVSSLPPHIEPGRVDIRLHALHTKLGKI